MTILLFAEDCLPQPLRGIKQSPSCIDTCLRSNTGCQDCVKELADRLSTPKNINLPFHKAHPGLRDPKVTLDHHNFVDRPPWVGGGLPPGHGAIIEAEGKTHRNCPAMKARSGVGGITLHMPYTVRFYREGSIEVDCHWIEGNPTHKVAISHPVDSPWMRMPQSHLQIFTVGDSRADVWIVNSGIYIDDTEYMSSPNAKPGGKGTSTGNKWMVLPIPHKIQPKTWRVEQGVLSSFLRTSKNANIPLQLNFTTLDDAEEYIEIEKDTPMMQYVPAVLPTVTMEEKPMPTPLADYLVMLSKMHKGGDIRVTKTHDRGAYDEMKSYQLKNNPGFAQSWKKDGVKAPPKPLRNPHINSRADL